MTNGPIWSSGSSQWNLPETRNDWKDWVSATATRNYSIKDPLLDWFSFYGESKGFKRDQLYPGYDPRTDFTQFIMGQGRRFEQAIIRLLQETMEIHHVCFQPSDSRDKAKADETFLAMKDGIPLIYQGSLWDPEYRTYGSPDLIVRSDILYSLFPNALSHLDAKTPGPMLGTNPWHYRVIDIKFRTNELQRSGNLNSRGSSLAYKVQLYIYNRALGLYQGFEPPLSYILGRGWRQGDVRGNSCLDRLAMIPQDGAIGSETTIEKLVSQATNWVRNLRYSGSGWDCLPNPSIPELFPNAGNQDDTPWHHAKNFVQESLEEITTLWQVGISGRENAHRERIFKRTDERLTPAIVNLRGENARKLEAILDIHKSQTGPAVKPAYITASQSDWQVTPTLEFYVDFEYVSDLGDDLSLLPEKGGQALIFMIGCGHIENGAWQFKSFIVDSLTITHQAKILTDWFGHMANVHARVDPTGNDPKVIHWSPAEVTSLESACDATRIEGIHFNWPCPNWFDFLEEVIKKEPVVIRGALSFGLKEISRALHRLGLIQTFWEDGPGDGLGAMVGAWWCQEEARKNGGSPLPSIELMKMIGRYNEVDCKVMQEIVLYLRKHHSIVN